MLMLSAQHGRIIIPAPLTGKYDAVPVPMGQFLLTAHNVKAASDNQAFISQVSAACAYLTKVLKIPFVQLPIQLAWTHYLSISKTACKYVYIQYILRCPSCTTDT